MQYTCGYFHHKRALWLERGPAWSATWGWQWAWQIRIESIEAHTTPSTAKGLAPTNPRAETMGSRANENFMVSKSLMSWERSRFLVPLYSKTEEPLLWREAFSHICRSKKSGVRLQWTLLNPIVPSVTHDAWLILVCGYQIVILHQKKYLL